MTTRQETLPGGFTCDEIDEIAGVYVLGALDASEELRVAEHLASCPNEHREVTELGGVVPAFAALVDPVEAPVELKSRVMAAYAAESDGAHAAAHDPARPEVVAPQVSAATDPASVRRNPATHSSAASAVWEMPDAQAPRVAPQRSWLGWAAAAMAFMLVAVVGVWGLSAQSRADTEAQRAATMAEALRVFGAPDSEVAVLRGSGAASNASGFAAFSPNGDGYVVMAGLPELPTDQTYQAWYLIDGQPVSAGLLAVDDDGLAVLARIPHHAGTDVIALTQEPAGGVTAPTSDPIVVGEIRPA